MRNSPPRALARAALGIVALLAAPAVGVASPPRATPTAQLPVPGDPKAELIGLLDLPSVLNRVRPENPPRTPLPPYRAIALYSAPDRSAKPIGRISSSVDLPTRESGYESLSAIVLERRPGWYRLSLPFARSAWIEASAAGTFHSLAELVVNRLAYLTGYWDGYVWTDPGAGQAIAYEPWRTATHRQAEVKVLGTQEVGGSLFVQVEILSESPCAGGTPKVVLSGWVPAFTPSGNLVVWFHSRGC